MNQANAQQMNFKVEDLIEKLAENRDKHVADYKEAFVGYLEKIKETLKTASENVAKGTQDYSKGFSISLPAPTSYEKEYNTIIQMLIFCTDETIMLDRSAFQNYVMDEWHWSTAFKATTSLYNAKVGE